MTEPAGIEAFYGDALHVLRWRRTWSVRKLAKESGVSKSSILNYERGRTVPRPPVRRKLARALGVSPARLSRLAAALHGEASAASGSLVAEVTADLAGDCHRATLPLVTQLVAGQALPPPPAATRKRPVLSHPTCAASARTTSRSWRTCCRAASGAGPL